MAEEHAIPCVQEILNTKEVSLSYRATVSSFRPTISRSSLEPVKRKYTKLGCDPTYDVVVVVIVVILQVTYGHLKPNNLHNMESYCDGKKLESIAIVTFCAHEESVLSKHIS